MSDWQAAHTSSAEDFLGPDSALRNFLLAHDRAIDRQFRFLLIRLRGKRHMFDIKSANDEAEFYKSLDFHRSKMAE